MTEKITTWDEAMLEKTQLVASIYINGKRVIGKVETHGQEVHLIFDEQLKEKNEDIEGPK